jgi:hypothetical protein
MLQTSYRASEAAPTSKVELLNEYWSSESVPSQAFCHPIECDPKENPFNIHYVRSGAVPTGDTVLMYDIGKTTLAVGGQQGTSVLGDLWVTYEIELRKPILTDINNLNVNTLSGAGSTAVSTTNTFGTNFSIRSSSFAVAPIVGTRTITFPPYSTGAYLIAIVYDGTTTAVNPDVPTITGAGSSILTTFGAANGKRTTYTVGTQDPAILFCINITQPATTTVVTSTLTTLTGASGVQLLITEVNPLML